jgi:hypothetical protein
MKKLLFATALFMAIGIADTNAQAVKKNTKQQTKRIKHGVRNGELTRAETKNLVNDQREIRNDVKDARADGTVTPVERKEIKKEQRQASREIARKKHNKRDRD